MCRYLAYSIAAWVLVISSCATYSYSPSEVTASQPPLMDAKKISAAKRIRNSPSGPRRVYESKEEATICRVHNHQLVIVEVPALEIIYSPTMAIEEETRAQSKYFPHYMPWHPEFFYPQQILNS